MISVSEASRIILDHLFKPAVKVVTLLEARNKILADAVVADRDFPPFHRVSMDGIAIRHDEWQKGRRTFRIEGTQAAGAEPKTLSVPSNCVEVMTGAVIPSGCDAVIRYEDLAINNGEATVIAERVIPWQSVHLRGADAKENEVLLQPGMKLASSEIALLASVGKKQVGVFGSPRIAIISTGDELVDVGEHPRAWQIRRSNAYAIHAALQEMDCDATQFHLQDEPSALVAKLDEIVNNFDALILSGGVSKGKFDFVPEALERIGVARLFHHVSQRPGKPFWFGTSRSGKVAFALPGNPVSTFMCFYKYVRPWIIRSLGATVPEEQAVLASDYSFPPPLTCFLQVSAKNEGGRIMAHALPGGGSGDFANLREVSGFLELPLEKSDFKAGEVYPYISFRH